MYLSKNLKHLKRYVVAGFNVTCVGDDRGHSFLPSRAGNTLADTVALHVLKHMAPEFRTYTFLDRGSDERQYCSPGVDLPVVSIMRTKYGQYPEYHTSRDDLDLISPSGLEGGYRNLVHCVECLEQNEVYGCTVLCEPQLGRRGLYPSLGGSRTGPESDIATMLNILAYCDGQRTLLEIANLIDQPIWELFHLVATLAGEGLLEPTQSLAPPAGKH